MAEDSRAGDTWNIEELDAIVGDYFAMLAADLGGRDYVKADHRRALSARLGRSHGSIEWKHQNISAVLETLGMPWIPGYKPALHTQKSAIVAVIERHFAAAPGSLALVDAVPKALQPRDVDLFVDPPPPRQRHEQVEPALARALARFDPVARTMRNRALGRAGEAFVVELERRRLEGADRRDRARRVRWIAEEDGDGAGYDVLSFEPGGRERLIEVKTTNGSARTPFYLTRNERAVSEERADSWRLYRLHRFSQAPRIFTIAPPLERVVDFTAESWPADLR
jgi:hypothetical protein